jgi:hypothetical protein
LKKYNSFQQQDGCQSRGLIDITVPSEYEEDYENDTIDDDVNGEEMGVYLIFFYTKIIPLTSQKSFTSSILNKYLLALQ